MQQDAHVAVGQPEHPADIRPVLAFHVPQQDDGALRRGQGFDRLEQALEQFAVGGEAFLRRR